MKKILFFLIFIFIFLKPQVSFAEVIHSFDTNIVAHKNGLMDFTETINYDFETEYKHGIYRYIPTFSKVGNLYRIIKISNLKIQRDSADENYSVSQTNEQINIKIGNANKTINGNHIYKISYTIENGIGSNFSDHDEIYWNITGNGWQVNIEKATAKISTDFNTNLKQLICFEGQSGSKDKTCSIEKNTASSSQILYPGYGLTIVAIYPQNSFPKSFLSKTPPQTFGEKLFSLILKNYFYIFIFLNFVVGGYLIYWYQKHKNKNKFGKPTVNFEIPKDEKGNILRPALCGTIDTAKLERDDIVATIFDLAIRKYIKLEEIKKSTKVLGVFNKTDNNQQIIKLKEDDGKLNEYEKKLFNRFFENGDTINVEDLRLDFYITFQDMEKNVFKILVSNKYYTKNPAIQKTLLFIASVFSFVTLNFILGIVLFFLSRKLNGRTNLGDEIDFKIDGLKLFLKSMDRNYKWQAQNFYTVEQMIPYAVALGYIDKFMEQLKIIKPDYNPSWYSGYNGSFYTSYAIFYAATNNNLTTTAPSSSSGSSGGFSGGGGGGGGGGSW